MLSRKFLQCRLSGLALAVAAVLLVTACRPQSGVSSAPGEYEGTALSIPATDFRLVNQHGTEVALSDFRQQVVVLTFMDSQCRDVCPLTAIELKNAHQTLGGQAGSAVFIGVNVNLEANQITDVEAATERWQLDEVPNWHFLTGSADELEPVWKAYGVAALPAPEGEGLTHTPGVYLIDQRGQIRWYISTPYDEAGTPQWTPPLSELLVKHTRALLLED